MYANQVNVGLQTVRLASVTIERSALLDLLDRHSLQPDLKSDVNDM